MVNDENWTLPKRKPITSGALNRAIETEEQTASTEHQAQQAWFDPHHGTVMLKLSDGRVFGAEPGLIPSLQNATPKQLDELHASENGAYLTIETLDLHVNVDGLITRLMESSPIAITRSGARLAGQTTSPAKAKASAQNGRLGGRPKTTIHRG